MIDKEYLLRLEEKVIEIDEARQAAELKLSLLEEQISKEDFGYGLKVLICNSLNRRIQQEFIVRSPHNYLKDFGVLYFGAGRQAGHTTRSLDIIPEFFKSSLFVYPSIAMRDKAKSFGGNKNSRRYTTLDKYESDLRGVKFDCIVFDTHPLKYDLNEYIMKISASNIDYLTTFIVLGSVI